MNRIPCFRVHSSERFKTSVAIMFVLNMDIYSYKYRMAGAFYVVKNSGDIPNNTLTSLSAVRHFHMTHEIG